MSLKTILSNVLPSVVAGALFILVSIIGFMEGGEYSPFIGSGIGTFLLIRSWDSSRKKGAEQLREHPMAFLMRKWSGSDEKPN